MYIYIYICMYIYILGGFIAVRSTHLCFNDGACLQGIICRGRKAVDAEADDAWRKRVETR